MPNESLTAQLVPHLCLLATLRSTGNVTRTAEILGVPQPTVSRRLAALGQALGAPLTVPDGRGVRLTRAAELLADAAERALPVVDAGVRLVREEIEPASGRVVLGFLHLLGRSLVPELLRTYREQAPSARFSLVQGSLRDMVDRLVSGELDLALLAPVVEDERLETVVLDRQPIHLSVPAGHRLAARRSVRVAELADEPFVLLEPGYGLRRITDDLCAAAGFTPKVAFEGQESDTVRGLVGAGLGVALLPRFEPGSPAGVAEVPLHPPVHRTIGMAWRAGEPLSPAVQAFRDHVLGRTD
ncbi:LysR family transcriptional regulator [Amycolatopsis rubida]|uniref:LysR family transcriptional regulator n=1 Tax=Amycolatopsis rubida TaxID=112413 RepID=A0ABX0BT73_9PSEU|nr:LysR family transcriptional regulator [Amycolatopsis sp. M39]MYW92339.1 LysR family transcriptional regulator [Amycolatopsis rubida]NEC57327.1 LysR family transcriptional regulator [Amycolatopsis rubida]OAP23796.1 HTH-type transcriptional regulator GltC [Amycolatopsis sp. M39]